MQPSKRTLPRLAGRVASPHRKRSQNPRELTSQSRWKPGESIRDARPTRTIRTVSARRQESVTDAATSVSPRADLPASKPGDHPARICSAIMLSAWRLSKDHPQKFGQRIASGIFSDEIASRNLEQGTLRFEPKPVPVRPVAQAAFRTAFVKMGSLLFTAYVYAVATPRGGGVY